MSLTYLKNGSLQKLFRSRRRFCSDISHNFLSITQQKKFQKEMMSHTHTNTGKWIIQATVDIANTEIVIFVVKFEK